MSEITLINTKEEKFWAIVCHAIALVGFIIPLGNLIGPLIIWSIKKDKYTWVNEQGKESLNFQITIIIFYFISILLMFVFIGFLLIGVIGLINIICIIIACIETAKGQHFRYPWTLRLIK